MKMRQIVRKCRRQRAKKGSLTIASGFLLSLAAGQVWADCTGSSGVYTCSGPTTTAQSVTGSFSPLQTDITSTFTGSLSGTNGVTIHNFDASGATAITSAGYFSTNLGTGLYAQNFGGGDLSLRQTGGSISGPTGAVSASILGTSGTGAITVIQDGGTLSSFGYAISAYNAANGGINIIQNAGTSSGNTYGVQVTNQGSGNVVITQASAGIISGGEYGIWVSNPGSMTDSGSVTITTAGTVSGAGMAGIEVTDQGAMVNGKDIIISQTGGTITSQSGNGIRATNYGAGILSITTNGMVTGGGGDGIYAQNELASAGDMTINQSGGTITGTANGITAQNQGTGSISITTAGDVEGIMQRGILVSNAATGGDISIRQTAGTITATNSHGIMVENNGSGATNVTVEGEVSTTGGSAINVYAPEVFMSGVSPGEVNITQTGTSVINADSNYGIYAESGGTSNLTITTLGNINAGTSGISATKQSDSDGDIIVTQAAGSIFTSGNGITTNHLGTGGTTIETSGTIEAANAGIYAINYAYTQGDLKITQTKGSISGDAYGIQTNLQGYGNQSITVNGAVFGGTAGIYAYTSFNGGTTEAHQRGGRIEGDYNGIAVESMGEGDVTVTTAGDVIGRNDNGISVHLYDKWSATSPAEINVNQSGGTITGGRDGLYMQNQSGQTLGTLGSTTADISATVTGGSGAGMYSESLSDQAVAINLHSGANVSASSGKAIVDTEGNAPVQRLSHRRQRGAG